MRLAIGIAQGIALGLDVPVLAVSTLQVLALRAPADATQVLACIDARMGEVYAGVFERRGDTLLELAPEVVCAPDALVLPNTLQRFAAVGTGFAAADALLQQRFATQLTSVDAAALPNAADLLTLAVPALLRGEGVAPERVEPAYLRDNVALTLVEQQAARAAKAAGAAP